METALSVAFVAIVVMLFYKFTRNMLVLSGVLVALSVLVISFVLLNDWLDYRKQWQVEVTHEYPSDKCTNANYPVYIEIENDSWDKVLKTKWDFEVRQKERSTNLATTDKSDSNYSSDLIIPFSLFGDYTAYACVAYPKLSEKGQSLDRNDLELIVTDVDVTFED